MAFDNVTYIVSGDNVTARFTVRFIAGQTTVMLLWGGHFADSRDYRFALWDDDKNAATAEHMGNLDGRGGAVRRALPLHAAVPQEPHLGDSTGIGSLSNNVQGSVLEPLPKASIAIAPTATNGIGESHTFTVTLRKDLDDGAGEIPAAGEHVTVTLGGAGGASCGDRRGGQHLRQRGREHRLERTVHRSCSPRTRRARSPGPPPRRSRSTELRSRCRPTARPTTQRRRSRPSSRDDQVAEARRRRPAPRRRSVHGLPDAPVGHDLNGGAGGYTDITPDVCFDVTDNVSGTDNTNALTGGS